MPRRTGLPSPRWDRRECWRLKRRRKRANDGEVEVSPALLRQDCGFRAQQDLCAIQLPAEEWSRFRSDCATICTECPDSSLFMDSLEAEAILAHRRQPTLLTYVAHLLRKQLQCATERHAHKRGRADRCGAEYWVQSRGEGEAINWHWDKDEQLRDNFSLWLHPFVATVTYLDDGGSPTVIFDSPRVGHDGALMEVKGSARVVASYPRAGKQLRFSGRLLHGCPPALAEPLEDGKRRMTLLVNIWLNHKPLGLTRLPSVVRRRLCCYARLSPDRGSTMSTASSTQTLQPLRVGRHLRVDRMQSAELQSLRIPVCGSHELTVRLPCVSKLPTQPGSPSARAARKKSGTFRWFNVPVVARELHE